MEKHLIPTQMTLLFTFLIQWQNCKYVVKIPKMRLPMISANDSMGFDPRASLGDGDSILSKRNDMHRGLDDMHKQWS
jgi:hypothetical protein